MSDVSERHLCSTGYQSEAFLLFGQKGMVLKSDRSSRLKRGQLTDEQMKAGNHSQPQLRDATNICGEECNSRVGTPTSHLSFSA